MCLCTYFDIQVRTCNTQLSYQKLFVASISILFCRFNSCTDNGMQLNVKRFGSEIACNPKSCVLILRCDGRGLSTLLCRQPFLADATWPLCSVPGCFGWVVLCFCAGITALLDRLHIFPWNPCQAFFNTANHLAVLTCYMDSFARREFPTTDRGITQLEHSVLFIHDTDTVGFHNNFSRYFLRSCQF